MQEPIDGERIEIARIDLRLFFEDAGSLRQRERFRAKSSAGARERMRVKPATAAVLVFRKLRRE
jgi:hypothetical protein